MPQLAPRARERAQRGWGEHAQSAFEQRLMPNTDPTPTRHWGSCLTRQPEAAMARRHES
jgi:hypothetical protein